MKTQYLNLMKGMPAMKALKVSLSLRPFVSFLEQKALDNNNVRVRFFINILGRIQQKENWDELINEQNIDSFGDLFELIYFTLSAPDTDEKEFFWALGEPLTPHIFFGTEAFFRLLTDKNGKIKEDVLTNHLGPDKATERMKIIYALILIRLYGIPYPASTEINISVADENSGLIRQYRIGFDTRFIDISILGPKPELDLAHFQLIQHRESESLAYLQKALPLDKIHFDGFSIVQIREVTEEFAIEKIKDIIVNLAPGQTVFHEVVEALKTLLNSNDSYVSLLPILKVNGKLVLDTLEEMDPRFREVCVRHQISKEKYLAAIERFMKNPRILIARDLSANMDSELQGVFQRIGVRGGAVIPVFFQKQLVGILEIFSLTENDLPADIMAKLKPAIPLLEQLLQATIHHFNLRIEDVIREQFTALHPAVHWRFNEAAWNYIQKWESDKNAVIENVHFPDVYPLYGAIDIRNSTVERNNALRNDMYFQLDLLEKLLHNIKAQHELSLIDELLYKTRSWHRQVGDYIIPEDEFRLYLFLENEVSPILELLSKRDDLDKGLIHRYLKATEPDGGVHANRRKMENTLQFINHTIATELDKMNLAIQQIYPCYFEKFRSDGIEYDIYIGQSISPQVEFYPFYLKNLRLVQLSSMVEIARQTKALVPQLSMKLETTQLIFINTQTIDISFRNDERRFDVEGGYNVRYEMMKKRIDKVHLLNSTERLTQPGKIAMIYFQQKDIDEYLTHIYYLQEKKMLEEGIEYLDLERLQGLDGLKALRITVKV